MFPVVDIAKILDLDRSNLSRLLKRNHLLFDGQTKACRITTPRGPQTVVLVSGFAAIGLLYKVCAIESKSPEIQEKIALFQKWATELIEKKMQAKLIQPDPRGMWHPPSVAVGEAIKRNMEAARTVSAEMGVPLDLAMAKALVLTSRETGMDLTSYSRLLPAKDSVVMDADYISA